MRVALLSANAQSGDAIGNQLAEKLAFFLDRGADVRIFVEDDTRLHPSVRNFSATLRKLAATGEAWTFLSSADLVIAEYGHYYLLLDLLPLLAGGKTRILLDYHGVTPPGLWGTHNREALEKGAQRRGLVWCADGAVVHSSFARQELLNPTGFPADRVHRLGCPLDMEWFCPGDPVHSLRDELGLRSAHILLFVGRLAPNKRVPVLVEALARLRDLTPAIHAVVIGNTEDLYQEEVRRCQERAQELDVADRLHILGRVDDSRLRDAYRSADVFVMPSRHEGFCIPVIEAMACGLPVVAARAGALPETVAAAGLTFTLDDADDLARQVRRVLEDDKMTRWQDDKMTGVDDKVTRWQGDKVTGADDKMTGADDKMTRWQDDKMTKQPSVVVHSQTVNPSLSSCHPVILSSCHRQSSCHLRLAVVAFRYGTDFVGGAETSLRTIAETLHQAGHPVEVFTTCTTGENDWCNKSPEGTAEVNGIAVHRFRIDPHERKRHLDSVQAIVEHHGPVPVELEREYLTHSIHSTRLLEALRARHGHWDALLAGPYLFGLTYDVAREFPQETLLVPCFHDEPFARLRTLLDAYQRVGGILYHSPEEQEFAEVSLSLNHPGAVCIGTLLDTQAVGDGSRGRKRVGTGQPYLVYCGRYSPQKELPALLDYARRYHEVHPGRFTFAFLGQGDVPIPRAPWACDLGFVDETSKRDVVAGAAALVQLSRLESLSLAALEAWAQGVPVLADERCAVLAGHLRRCQGGHTIDSYEAFASALDDLWQHPERWRILGRRGQEYVQTRYGSPSAFTDRLVAAIKALKLPLAERMRRQGRQRAEQFSRAAWREQFGRLVENVLDAPARLYRERVEVQPRSQSRTVAAGLDTVWMPVRVVNHGTHALVADGPGRLVLRGQVLDGEGRPAGKPGAATPLPALAMPGRALAAAVPVPVPDRPGTYRVAFRAERFLELAADNATEVEVLGDPDNQLRLLVEEKTNAAGERCCAPLLEEVQTALVEADRRQRLPDDYLDVCNGWLASWKRWVKRKLLGNFKRAYVDVLARQQSDFNRHVLTALHELTECCATLDHAGGVKREHEQGERAELRAALADLRAGLAVMEERLSRLEMSLSDAPSGVVEVEKEEVGE